MILIFSLNCVFAIIAQNESNFMKNIISSKVISSFLFPAYYFDFKTRMENHCLLWRRVDIMQKFWDWFSKWYFERVTSIGCSQSASYRLNVIAISSLKPSKWWLSDIERFLWIGWQLLWRQWRRLPKLLNW